MNSVPQAGLPARPPTPLNTTVIRPSTTQRSIEAISGAVAELENQLGAEREKRLDAEHKSDELSKRVIDLQARNDLLEQQQILISARHDATAAAYTSLLTQLQSISSIIADACRAARAAGNDARKSPISPDDDAKLKKLAEHFGFNDKDKEHSDA